MTTEQLAALKEVAEKAHKSIPGPYFVASDDAHDVPDHKDSGLALVETGRSDDWWVARLCEWPTAKFIAAFDPTTCLELLEEVERLRTEGMELSTTIEACHAMLDKLDPEYQKGMTTLVPIDTRLHEFLWPEGRITDDMVNGDD